MRKFTLLCLALALGVGLFAPTDALPAAASASTTLLLSEVQVAGSTDADLEFIEIYNVGDLALAPTNYKIIYRSASGTSDVTVYTFAADDLIPARGHFLLVRSGKSVGVTPDATFAASLSATGGGLALRDTGGVVIDSVGWGTATNAFVESQAAPAPAAGGSIERLPGSTAGNGQDTDNNRNDFRTLATPFPQNTLSELTPGGGSGVLTLSKSAPERVNPGEPFTYTLTLRNLTGSGLTDVVLTDTLPANVQFVAASDGGTQVGNRITWNAAALADGATLTRTLAVTASEQAGAAMVNATYSATASNWVTPTAGSAVTTTTRIPSMEVAKSAPAQTVPGATFTYRLTVQNASGNAAATWLSDTLPGPVAFVGATGVYTWNAGTRTVLWDLGTLANGASAERTITVTAPSTLTTLVNANYAVWTATWPTPTTGAPVTTTVGNESCPTSNVTIPKIQGHGTASPCANKSVSNVTGCVIGVAANGYYLQDQFGDSDPYTSDGLYIYKGKTWTNSEGITVGKMVRFSGPVTEFYNTTEVAYPTSQSIIGNCSPMPGYADYGPLTSVYQNPETLYEPLEGMRVRLQGLDGFVEGATRRYVSRFPAGDPEIAYIPYSFYENQLLINHPRIFQEDYPGYQGLMYLSGGLNQDLPSAEFGDRLSAGALTGVMAYQFDKYTLLVDQPYTGTLTVQPNPTLPVTRPIAPLQPTEFGICTMNVENLFDTVDDGDGDMGDWSPESEAEYALWLNKRAAVFADELRSCTVIGIEEVEGKEQVWADLAATLNTRLGNPQRFTFDYYESQDTRDITVGILYDTWQARVISSTQRQGCTAVDYSVSYSNALPPRVVSNPCGSGKYPLFDRPPYVATVAVTTTQPYTFTIMVNHFKSKRGEESENLPRREAQASWVVTLTRQYAAANPVVIVGDLNDYLASTPIQILTNATDDQGRPLLINVVSNKIPKPEQYSYVFSGESEVLDHYFVTRNMESYLTEARAVHINADYPATLVEDSSAHRSSDHDPLFVRFRVLPGIGLVKQVDPATGVSLGEVVTYTLNIVPNEGESAASAWLTDTLPAGITFGGWIGQPAGVSYSNGTLYWTGAVNQEITLTFTATATTDPAFFGATVVNTGTLSANGETRTSQAAFAMVAAPSLQNSVKTVDRTTARPGELLTYTITLENSGGSPAAAILTDTLHPALTFVSGTPGLAHANGRLTWSGSILPGASRPLTLTVRIAALSEWLRLGSAAITNTVTLNNGYGMVTTAGAAPVQIAGLQRIYLPLVVKQP